MNSQSPSLGRNIVYADRRNEECVDTDISLVTYNILADFYLQPARTKGNYKRCPKEYAARDEDCLRHKLLFTEVRAILFKLKRGCSAVVLKKVS